MSKAACVVISTIIISIIVWNRCGTDRKESEHKMAEYDFMKMQKKLSGYMDEERFQHTLGVMFTSAALAMAHRASVKDAQAAGLLHDCAKCIPNKKKLELCEKYEIQTTEFERRNPFLLHSKLGAFLAKEKYKIVSEDILNAITYHTTGRPDMSTLEKIVFIADYIEPMRDKARNLDEIRNLAYRNLDQCMYKILKDTLEYLSQSSGEIDNTTQIAYEYYRHLCREQTGKEK